MDPKRVLINSLAGLALAAGLAGCGFQLRGQAQLPFASAYVEGRSVAHDGGNRNERHRANSISLAAALSQALISENKLARNASEASVRVFFLNERLSKSILALSGGGKVREYRLSYRVILQVNDASGRELIAPSEIFLNRDYSYSDAETLAKEAEEATLIRGMEQEALRQVLRRLSYIKR